MMLENPSKEYGLKILEEGRGKVDQFKYEFAMAKSVHERAYQSQPSASQETSQSLSQGSVPSYSQGSNNQFDSQNAVCETPGKQKEEPTERYPMPEGGEKAASPLPPSHRLHGLPVPWCMPTESEAFQNSEQLVMPRGNWKCNCEYDHNLNVAINLRNIIHNRIDQTCIKCNAEQPDDTIDWNDVETLIEKLVIGDEEEEEMLGVEEGREEEKGEEGEEEGEEEEEEEWMPKGKQKKKNKRYSAYLTEASEESIEKAINAMANAFKARERKHWEEQMAKFQRIRISDKRMVYQAEMEHIVEHAKAFDMKVYINGINFCCCGRGIHNKTYLIRANNPDRRGGPARCDGCVTANRKCGKKKRDEVKEANATANTWSQNEGFEPPKICTQCKRELEREKFSRKIPKSSKRMVEEDREMEKEFPWYMSCKECVEKRAVAEERKFATLLAKCKEGEEKPCRCCWKIKPIEAFKFKLEDETEEIEWKSCLSCRKISMDKNSKVKEKMRKEKLGEDPPCNGPSSGNKKPCWTNLLNSSPDDNNDFKSLFLIDLGEKIYCSCKIWDHRLGLPKCRVVSEIYNDFLRQLEISKCDLRCIVCDKIKTYLEQDIVARRVERDQIEAPDDDAPVKERDMKVYKREQKLKRFNKTGCTGPGEEPGEPCLLEGVGLLDAIMDKIVRPLVEAKFPGEKKKQKNMMERIKAGLLEADHNKRKEDKEVECSQATTRDEFDIEFSKCHVKCVFCHRVKTTRYEDNLSAKQKLTRKMLKELEEMEE